MNFTKSFNRSKILERQRALSLKIPDLRPHFIDITLLDGSLVPFLPIGAFRNFSIFGPKEPHTVFRSSGSTNDNRAEHAFSQEGLKRYQNDSVRNFSNFLSRLGLGRPPLISLVPAPCIWKDSSLAAMIDFFSSAFSVHYWDAEGDRFDTHSLAAQKDWVIFGTSAHHIMMSLKDGSVLGQLAEGRNLTVIDTGGTKSKTRHFSLQEIHERICATYPNAAQIKIVSEYGMCELASQAWSLQAPHDGWFQTNDTLVPVCIDIKARKQVPFGQQGYLAFIDSSNVDSYSAIITEDLAVQDHYLNDRFLLVARAPQASIKGCSLKVHASFFSTSTLPTPPIELESSLRALSELPELISNLDASIWDPHARADLQPLLKSIAESQVEMTNGLNGLRIAMILSANIPVTFLYPSIMAHLLGAHEVHLLLPSIRADDPLSERVRLQITTLAKALASFVAPMKVYAHTTKDLCLEDLLELDRVLAFGSDTTIATLRAALGQKRLVGLGDINNTVTLGNHTPKELAESCSRWMGRGCLTPVAWVGDPDTSFVHALATLLEQQFAERWRCAGAQARFVHDHRMLEWQAFGAHIIQGEHSAICDVRKLHLDHQKVQSLVGGMGCLFVLTPDQRSKLPQLHDYPSQPGFLDPHQGKGWSEWLTAP